MSSQGPLRDGGAPGFHLIETLRHEPGTGLVRGSLHLDRLERSAHALRFAMEREKIEAYLRELPPFEETCRIRMTLEFDGTFAVTSHPFTPVAANAIWAVRVATARLSSSDPLLRHKTSAGAGYAAARAEFTTQEADEIILLNEAGQVCEGTITSVFLRDRDGILTTPPLDCGLLDGVLRRELLSTGQAMEGVLRPSDLEDAAELFVGNSLRGLVRARLAVSSRAGE